MASGIPISVGGNVYAGKGKTEETITTHQGSHVTAADTLTMNSGKDTDIKGSQVSGNKVNADIKGNLTIESEQNKQTYREENKQSGAGFTTDITSTGKGLGGTSISGGANKSHTRSNYESVTEQSGIYAGQEGYDITVKGNTDLKGSVIDSDAPSEKNHLTTGTLTWNDIDNKADYKAEGKGIAYTKGDNASLNAKGLTPTIAPTVKDEAESTTKSGVAAGKVTITDKGNQKQDIKDLNRDTKNSLNKLGEIFDKAKVEEKQELISILSKEGNEAIHKMSDYYGWEEGSTEKALAHGVLGAITGELSGGSLTGSAIAGGMSEYVTGYIEKKMGTDWMLSHPDVVQAISVAVGGTIGDITGAGSVSAYIAQNAAKWNYFGFAIPQTEMLKDTLVKEDGSKLTDKEAEQLSRDISDTADNIDPYTANTDTLEKGDTEVKDGVKEYLKGQGFTEESIDRYFSDYDKMVDKQNQEMESGRNYVLKPVKIIADTVESGSDNKTVKHVFKIGGYIGDAADIFSSNYPRDAIFSTVTSAEFSSAMSLATYLVLSRVGMGRIYALAVAGGSGAYFGDEMKDKIDTELNSRHKKSSEEPGSEMKEKSKDATYGEDK